MKRLTTGITHLDDILGGGLPEASIHIIAGQPGSGKTLLAQHLLYQMATPEQHAVYYSTVNEPLHKMLRFVQDFAFFDEAKVGKAVRYEDIGPRLVEAGVPEVLAELGERAVQEQPSFVVIDSFRALGELASDPVDYRKALFQLTGQLTATGCTTFLVGEYGPQDVLDAPEAAIADGIVLLTNERRGIRTYRYLSVVKMRGSAAVEGLHAVRLTARGFSVFPRFRTPVRPAGYETTDERVSAGNALLDRMVGGGYLRRSSTLVAGPSGGGKTHLALAFAFAAARDGEPVLFASFGEDPSQLARVASRFGWDLEAARADGRLDLLYIPPVELDIDEHVLKIVDRLRETGAAYVVIDSLSDMAAAAYDEERFKSYLYSLVQLFKDAGITSVLTYETVEQWKGITVGTKDIARLADNVVLLNLVREGHTFLHELAVAKTRGTGHEYDVGRFRIGERGIEPVEEAGRRGEKRPAVESPARGPKRRR